MRQSQSFHNHTSLHKTEKKHLSSPEIKGKYQIYGQFQIRYFNVCETRGLNMC